MNKQLFSKPLPLTAFEIKDDFWLREMELVRKEVIPYQWDALNDQIPDAAPSYCMHNFKAAARLNARRKANAAAFILPAYPLTTFETLPEDRQNPDPDRFYGFVFQDTDFYKWIEAVGYSLILHPDPDLEATADEAIEIVCQAQLEDGYLDTYYILNDMRFAATNLRNNHELYCLGHLIEGAVSYYQATKKTRLLTAACRFSDWAIREFGRNPGQKRGYPGHEIAEMALIRLYEVTNETKYLDLARYFIDERGQDPHYFHQEECADAARNNKPLPKPDNSRFTYYQAHIPVREQKEALGHAVRAMYLYSGMADVARLTQDDSLAEACRALFQSATSEKMYITGGVGSSSIGEAFTYPFDLPNDSAYAETCASIGLIFFARRMLQMEPKGIYADIMERALYNTVLSGMAHDGKSFFYVNPLEVVPEACHRDQRLQHVKTIRQKWFGCACCPPNIARLITSLPAYAYTQTDDTLYTHLYIGGKVRTTLQEKDIQLNVKCSLPWSGHVSIEITADQVTGKLAFRIPGWARNHQYICDHKQAQIVDGYLLLEGIWNTGDNITLDFPMETDFFSAAPRVKEDIGKVCVCRGPIVYCAEEHDNGKDLHQITVEPRPEQQFILHTDTQSFNHPVITIDTEAFRTSSEQASLYRAYQQETSAPSLLRLIPYYCWANRGENEMRVWISLKRS